MSSLGYHDRVIAADTVGIMHAGSVVVKTFMQKLFTSKANDFYYVVLGGAVPDRIRDRLESVIRNMVTHCLMEGEVNAKTTELLEEVHKVADLTSRLVFVTTNTAAFSMGSDDGKHNISERDLAGSFACGSHGHLFPIALNHLKSTGIVKELPMCVEALTLSSSWANCSTGNDVHYKLLSELNDFIPTSGASACV